MNRNLIPLVSLLACLAAFSVSAQTAKAPNIVFILIDDMGYADLSCYGSDYFETPNIDRLASEGTRFTSAYAACTVCSPTRASLMTGKYPARLHITHAIPIEGHLRRKETRYKDADYVKNMPLEEFTIAEAFKEAGYTTGFIGKWHCNWDEEYLPQYQGFDINIGGDWMGNPGDYFFPYKGEWRMTPEHPYRKWQVVSGGNPGEYLTDRLGQEAVKFIEENRDRPFFLYLAHYAVHTPIMAKPELVNNYSAKAPDKLRGQSDPEYAAMIESVDDSVGAILESLKRLNLDDNTIVVFTSDNGGARHYSNYPWRGEKGNFYEGGIRVPAIVKWPGRIPSGVTIDAVIISPDFYPTLLDLAGLPLRPNQHLDGLSLTELLTNGVPLQREAVFWHFPHYINKNIDMRFPTSTIRKGDWKLVEYLEDGHIELYNLSEDPGETSDLAYSRLDKAEELRADLVDFRIRTQAQSLRPR